MPAVRERALQDEDDGFMLLAVIVMIFLVLLALSVAAPRIATQIKRERELEAQHRANQYVRAIQLYYKKFNHYPGTLEELDKTNNQRFLRAHYLDPLTGKDDWRLIRVGENKTKVKGLFGEDLPGLGGTGLGGGLGGGAATGGAAAGGTTQGGSAFGGTGSAFGGAGSTPGGATGNPGMTTAGGPGSGSASGGTAGNDSGNNGVGSTSVSDLKGTGGAFMGVGVGKAGSSILVVNEQTSYDTWEFLYDPRIEQLKARWSLFGGGIATGGLSNGGQSIGLDGLSNGFGNDKDKKPDPASPPKQ